MSLECVALPTPPQDLIDWIADALARVPPGGFLLVEYLAGTDLPVQPYAQAARCSGGWSCEVVSDRYLPEQHWPLDGFALLSDGWRPPSRGIGRVTGNWWRGGVESRDAATVLVHALWYGRGCHDVDDYAVSVGTLPTGRPGGGERSGRCDLPVVA